MERPGGSLAARFRKAIEDSRARREREEEERQRRLAAARRAREDLLSQLAEFGDAIGHVAVKRSENAVTLGYQPVGGPERTLQFEAAGEGDVVRVTFDSIREGEEHRLYREPELGSRWVWALRRFGREDRLPLFDSGLEELVVLALQLPRPTEVGTGQPSPTLEDVVPREAEVTYEPPDEPAAGGGAKRRKGL